MPKDFYYTLNAPAESFFKEKGSKFYTYAFHVKDEEDIKEKLEGIRKKHYDARHHCYAYYLGQRQEISRANDDGEPSNTAGKPILGQLQAFELTYTLVIVVRYFGGTKLGVGGLIQAYKEGAKLALEEADILEKTINTEYVVHFGYPEMNTVMRFLKDLPVTDVKQDFMETCKIFFSIREGESEKAELKFANLKNITLENLSEE